MRSAHCAILRSAALLAGGLIAITVSCPGCSVKEDRSECDCLLWIYPDQRLESEKYRLFSNLFSIRDAVSGEEYSAGSLDGDGFARGRAQRLGVRKRDVDILALFAPDGMREADGLVTINEGDQADSIFVHRRRLNCRGETASDTLKLLKQWCSLYIHLDDGKSHGPGDVSLEGSWNGFDVKSLRPLRGAFAFSPDTLTGGRFLIRVPRQADSSLRMQVISPHDRFVKSYPLGAYMARSRFDWTKESLDDAIIYIDKASVRVEVLTRQWNSGTDYGTVEF